MPIKDKQKRAEYNRTYRQKNKERLAKKRKEWESKNKDYLKEYHKEYHKKWYQEHKTERQQQIKKYGKEHKEDAVRRVQKYTRKNKTKVYAYGKEYNKTTKGIYRSYVSSARKRGYEFNLSIEEFAAILVEPCSYCGDVTSQGVDRIDSGAGYDKDNCCACCKICNYMKKNYSVEEFISHIKKIYNQQSP